MGDREKWVFRDILSRLEAFCGVRCLTFCLMGNHFHLLVEVRDGEQEEFVESAKAGRMDAELCGRVRALYGKKAAVALGEELEGLRARGEDGEAWGRLEPLVGRMNDLAIFVKELKWRFSAWFNGENGRVGTLWESRFRSMLIEGSQEALTATAAYIDLNPVRAGLAEDSKDYRSCGYAEAVAGKKGALEGLRRVLGGGECGLPAAEVLSRYRLLLFGKGREARDESGSVVLRKGYTDEAVEAVESAGGTLPMQELLRSRARHLTEGAALGSREFLERLMKGRRGFFRANRKVAGRPIRGGGWGGLCTVRDLKG
ncbi:hypothetical protein BH23VER1_BH23VER1_25260 [soil metagenome]